MGVYFNKFLLFGDSITQYSFDPKHGFGAGAALQNLYIRKLDVLDRGFSGYNSEHARLILPQILEAELNSKSEIKLMTIFFGTNDGLNTFQHVPLPRYIENMEFSIGLAQERKIKTIIIGPGLHESRMYTDKPLTSNKIYREINDELGKLCSKLDVPFVDTWKQFQKDSGYSEEDIINGNHPPLSKYVNDGVHYTGHAYEVLYKAIVDVIEKVYPECAASNLSLMFPAYAQLNTDNLNTAIFKDVNIQ